MRDSNGLREIAAPNPLQDNVVFGGHPYSLPLSPVFDQDITK